MELHQYQKNCANFMAKNDRCILSVDMGLGKTAATLHYVEWLKPKSMLIVAPKRVAETVWMQEAEKWGLKYTHERMIIVKGTAEKRKAQLQDSDRPYKVIGRDNLGDVLKYTQAVFDVLIMDELTSFKSISAKRTKAIMEIKANHRIGLTGTFLANGAIDVYGQAAACGLGLPPYNFYGWRAMNFRDVLAGSGLQFQKWKLTKTLAQVLAPIQERIYTLSAVDYLEIPKVQHRVHKVELGNEEKKAYENLQSFLQFEIGDEVMSFDEQQKFCKLQQLCDGFVYDVEGETVRGKESSKLEEVAEFCERAAAEGESVLLAYAYKGEKEWLKEKLKARGLKVGDVNEQGFVDKWNAHEYDVLMAHPASAGHGLNLQHGGHILVWSSLTYNYELFAQFNARLARQGQEKSVQIHYFIASDTIEEQQQRALQKKDKAQQEFVKLTK